MYINVRIIGEHYWGTAWHDTAVDVLDVTQWELGSNPGVQSAANCCSNHQQRIRVKEQWITGDPPKGTKRILPPPWHLKICKSTSIAGKVFLKSEKVQ